MGESGYFQAVENTKTGDKPNTEVVGKGPQNINNLHLYPWVMAVVRECYYKAISKDDPQQNDPEEGQAGDDEVRQRDFLALEPVAAINQPNEAIHQISKNKLCNNQNQEHSFSESQHSRI